MRYLDAQLAEYCASDAYPFHMPGHKRRTPEELAGFEQQIQGTQVPYHIDITEIDGFDNLHHAEGILLEARQRLAELYGSEESFYLINGSTGGILSAVSACTAMGGTLLMARNCHKAVYHSAQIRGLKTEYLYPQIVKTAGVTLNGSVMASDVENALAENKEIQAVLITSPTYDGVVSDVCAIAEVTHRYGVPLIVDEAHGAHFGFHPYFPENSVKLGADIVIHSLHKTLPAMTQTAALHVNGSLVDRDKLREYLGIYQTSSPSYVLMAGIDRCVKVMAEHGIELMEAFAKRLQTFRREALNLKGVNVLEFPELVTDPSKILMAVSGKTGAWLANELRRNYHLEMEMETTEYALALTSVADTDGGFERLLGALREISSDEGRNESETDTCIQNAQMKNEQRMSIAKAKELKGKRIALEDSAGSVSKEYIYLYPPGIPLVVPGEVISEPMLQQLLGYQKNGMSLQGMKDYSGRMLEVISI